MSYMGFMPERDTLGRVVLYMSIEHAVFMLIQVNWSGVSEGKVMITL